MRIAYVGNFNPLSVGEPEIAKCLEELGHTVCRYQEGCDIGSIEASDLVLFAKMRCGSVKERQKFLASLSVPSICWVFDLYFGLFSDETI